MKAEDRYVTDARFRSLVDAIERQIIEGISTRADLRDDLRDAMARLDAHWPGESNRCPRGTCTICDAMRDGQEPTIGRLVERLGRKPRGESRDQDP